MNRTMQNGLSLLSLLIALSLVTMSTATAQEVDEEAEEAVEEVDEPAVPEGYSQDENGKLFQTSFDLQRRFYLGLYDLVRFDAPDGFGAPEHSLAIEAGGVYEVYDPEKAQRHRHRFLQGRLLLSPFEIDALFYSYDWSRLNREPTFWISTFIGEPRRYDIPIEMGFGYSLGDLHYRRTDEGDLMLLDLVEGHINWELFQGENLEDRFLISTGLGMGFRHLEGTHRPEVYGFPEVGFEAAWAPGESGLNHLSLEGQMQWSWELDTGQAWKMGTARLTAERILIAVNDQPISLFVAPEVRYSRIDMAGIDGVDYRVMAGARLSLFVPTRSSNTGLSW